MGVIVLGPLVNDILTMFVFQFSGMFPGKYWLLVITPVLEGIMECKSVCCGSVSHNEILVYSVPFLHPQWLQKHHTCAMSWNHKTYMYPTAKFHGRKE
jgi:hypothetical protein